MKPQKMHIFSKVLVSVLGLFPVVGFILTGVIVLLVYTQIKLPLRDLSQIAKLEDEFVAVDVVKKENTFEVTYTQTKNRPKNWVGLDEISHFLVTAIVTSEDARFHEHFGIDTNQLTEVLIEYFSRNDGLSKLRGASTIEQQLIKNIYLTSEKSIKRKFVEIIEASYLDTHVTKYKILETYLNVIEYGPGIYGIKAASEYYFKTAPKNLNPRQGAFLAMLLPSPVRYSQSFRQRRLTPFAVRITNSILYKMYRQGYLEWEEFKLAYYDRFSWERHE